MRKILFLLLVCSTFAATAQNNDYLVTAKGIGALKLGMKKAALEKVLNKKITLKYLSDKDSGYADTIKTKYKNADVTLYLGKEYVDENTEVVVLNGILCSSPLCKTKSGIGIGDDKMKIINTYEFNSVNIWPEFEDENYTRRSKTKSVIYVTFDDDENTVVFHLVNKKVVSFEVTYYEGD